MNDTQKHHSKKSVREKLDMLKELALLLGEIHAEELKLNMRVTDIIIQILKD